MSASAARTIAPIREVPEYPYRDHDERKRHSCQENRHEREARNRNRHFAAEGALPDANNRLRDERHHGRFQPEKQPGDQRVIAPAGIHDAEHQDGEKTRQNEQCARATSPPRVPCRSHPTYVASCCASGPGNNMQKLSACRNLSSPIQRFSSTRIRCITAIWPAGPPKLSSATRTHVRSASEKGTSESYSVDIRIHRQGAASGPQRGCFSPRWRFPKCKLPPLTSMRRSRWSPGSRPRSLFS